MSDRTFVDTGILVGALLARHPEHAVCRASLQADPALFTNAHCLAETFATLTGFYKVPNDKAAELTLSICETIQVEPLLLADYQAAIGQAHQRGVMGGGIYDSLHATVARRSGANCVITRNPDHFAHCAPDLKILVP